MIFWEQFNSCVLLKLYYFKQLWELSVWKRFLISLALNTIVCLEKWSCLRRWSLLALTAWGSWAQVVGGMDLDTTAAQMTIALQFEVSFKLF